MSNKPSLAKGTRDFGPRQMANRNFIFKHITDTFKNFGFLPIETPAIENLSVLMGKYGDEGDQLLFKILNSGNFLSKCSEDDFKKGESAVLNKISEKGLRYDLTVPFARFVVMNRNDITLPFKRYQIQPVWRADRPQKGRYREFYQCDADVVGTDSLLCEAEIIWMMEDVFAKLGITDYDIKINNRKILTGITEVLGASGKEVDFCVAIDKVDKIGVEKVCEELATKGFSTSAQERTSELLKGNLSLEDIKKFLANSEVGMKGVAEIEEVLEIVKNCHETTHAKVDITLARGLGYYTGCIFEVKVNNVKMGSISGGGRYDDLTGVMGMPGLSGVGFSFGVDRIYDVMDELNLFPKHALDSTQLLVIALDDDSRKYAYSTLASLRKANVKSELYPDAAKMKKMIQYAEKKGIGHILIIGENERTSGKLSLKNLNTGEQVSKEINEVIDLLNIIH
ncbi:MAG: histidine--tRNA ligase [Cyclobacteriaceae bacterium]|nr:histidine--tRNA ligase [Cyclobacteriaceae bacterium]MCH8517680.1 histidine--tRNA ligase [Cyclobacteriaceae bacterium]